jgi:hypothetical protein
MSRFKPGKPTRKHGFFFNFISGIWRERLMAPFRRR